MFILIVFIIKNLTKEFSIEAPYTIRRIEDADKIKLNKPNSASEKH